MEQTITGKSCWISVDAFQSFVRIAIQERIPQGRVCRDVISIKTAKRLIKHLESAIAEVEETDGSEN